MVGRIVKGAARGACADCGYRAWLEADGTVPEHEVRRVQRGDGGGPQIYKGTETGDEQCTGAGKPPEDMPRTLRPRGLSGRIAA